MDLLLDVFLDLDPYYLSKIQRNLRKMFRITDPTEIFTSTTLAATFLASAMCTVCKDPCS